MTRQAVRFVARSIAIGLLVNLGMGARALRADQVEMLNGDHYIGRVVSLSSDTLVVQSEVLGLLKIPRAKISTITLGSATGPGGTNAVRVAEVIAKPNKVPRAAITVSTNVSPDFANAMRQLTGSSNSLEQVQQQLLAGAGPEAQAKFNDLIGGLMTGRLNMEDLRTQARATLNQARSARKDLGEDSGGAMMDSYMAILDSFLKESESANPSTNAPVTRPETKAPTPAEEQ
jgi:hypothetical protein